METLHLAPVTEVEQDRWLESSLGLILELHYVMKPLLAIQGAGTFFTQDEVKMIRIN